MAEQAPLTQQRFFVAPAVATGADATNPAVEAPFAGTVTQVTYTPITTLTGADTNSRTVSLVNKGPAGAGNTTIATLAFTNGVNAPALVEKVIPLSGTPANLVVAAEDQLAWVSTHIGTGLADPGGRVEVTFSRTP